VLTLPVSVILGALTFAGGLYIVIHSWCCTPSRWSACWRWARPSSCSVVSPPAALPAPGTGRSLAA